VIINNYDALVEHGNTAGRRVVLDVLQAGLAAPDPYWNVRKIVRVEGGRLIVGNPALSDPPGRAPAVFDLAQVGRIYVVGGGKSAQRMAEALEDVLGDLITEGQINAKKGDSIRLKRVRVTLAGHPLPDEDSIAGSQRIIEIERKARPGDVVFHCTSGGATALTALPAPGISLADLQEVYRVLYFGCGANMPAANAVRNHLVLLHSRHLRYVKGATFIQLHTPELPPYLRPHLFEPPKPEDGYEAAIEVLKSYNCWERVPKSVRRFLLAADPRYLHLRPEEKQDTPCYEFRVMGPEYMIDAARARAEELGLNAVILATSLNDIETRPIAEALAYIATEIEALGRPFKPPCLLISGGELVVAVGEATGRGGRNQEFVLATAAHIAGSRNIVIASVDSEGTDGPTDAAGGIADGETLARVQAAGIRLAEELANHNSYPTLAALDDLIFTGIRGMNVRDLRLIYVGAAPYENG
jgi:glycerate 2-kinase